MAAVPLKPAYRPTLFELLAPSWRRASGAARLLLVAAGVVVVVALAGLVLTLLPARISHGGSVPFSFSYRGLHRTAPDGGGLVKVVRLGPGGRLEDSFAVHPLTLPAYRGSVTGELPLYAANYIRNLAARYRGGFELRGEGKARVGSGAAYNVYYTARVAGRLMYGRDFLLLPERPFARVGVAIVMLTAPHANAQVTSPLLVATAGLLSGPLHSFSFG